MTLCATYSGVYPSTRVEGQTHFVDTCGFHHCRVSFRMDWRDWEYACARAPAGRCVPLVIVFGSLFHVLTGYVVDLCVLRLRGPMLVLWSAEQHAPI